MRPGSSSSSRTLIFVWVTDNMAVPAGRLRCRAREENLHCVVFSIRAAQHGGLMAHSRRDALTGTSRSGGRPAVRTQRQSHDRSSRASVSCSVAYQAQPSPFTLLGSNRRASPTRPPMRSETRRKACVAECLQPKRVSARKKISPEVLARSNRVAAKHSV
jgi:hypothetical protein